MSFYAKLILLLKIVQFYIYGTYRALKGRKHKFQFSEIREDFSQRMTGRRVNWLRLRQIKKVSVFLFARQTL